MDSSFICLGIYSTPELSKYITLSPFTSKAIHCAPIDFFFANINYVFAIIYSNYS